MAVWAKLLRNRFKSQDGFGLVEIIVAMGLLVVIAAVGATTVIGSFSTNRLGNEEGDATLYAQEGIEAARSLKKQDWLTTFLGTSCSSGCGLSTGGGSWAWSGSSDTKDEFTRVVTVSDVQRNGSGVVVTSGGTDDPDTKLVTSTVTWDFTPTRQNTVSVASYFTNFVKAIGGSWSNPSVAGSLDLSGNQNANKVAVSGNYAYVVRSGTPDFSVINISNPASPTLVSSLDLDGNPLDISISGSYAYVASDSNSQELQIVNITNPASPTLAGSLDLARNNDAYSVIANGTTIYLGRDASNQEQELYVISAANPASPSVTGTLELGADVNSIAQVGNYLYLATDANASEIVIANVAVAALPVQAGFFNTPGNTDGEAIAAATGKVIFGDGTGTLYAFSLPTAITLSQQATHDAGTSVNDISLSDDALIAFLATSNNAQDFQAIDISSLSSLSLIGSIDLSGNLNGVAYSTDIEHIVAVGDSNSTEVEIIAP